MELVAKQIPKDGIVPEVTYPVSTWLRFTGVYHHKKFRMLVQSMNDLRLISAQCMNNLCNISELSTKDLLTISIPNILKFRDEYSKKSGQNPEGVRSKIQIQKQIQKTDKEIKPRASFAPPTIEEVLAYCTERRRGVNPHKWHDHYTAKNWMIGKNKMKDWKAAVRTWEQDTEPAPLQERVRRFEL